MTHRSVHSVLDAVGWDVTGRGLGLYKVLLQWFWEPVCLE